jgi:hypothetical protein
MGIIETPQETLDRLNAQQGTEVTIQPTHPSSGKGLLRRGRNTRDPHPRIRLLLTVLVGVAALVFSAPALVNTWEMSRYGELVSAEVLSVDHHSRGGSAVDVAYQVDGTAFYGHVYDHWGAPDPGESTDIVVDERDPTHITDAPLAVSFILSGLGVGFGAWLLLWAVRDVYRRRVALRGSQWLPD